MVKETDPLSYMFKGIRWLEIDPEHTWHSELSKLSTAVPVSLYTL